MEKQVKRYTATAAKGCWVTSVHAYSIEEARVEIERQLSKPGREQVKKTWIAYGRTVREF
jgi:hypothetical protein